MVRDLSRPHQDIPRVQNLVPAPSPTTSGETSVRAPWIVTKTAGTCEICLANNSSKLGSGLNKPTNGSIAKTRIYIRDD